MTSLGTRGFLSCVQRDTSVSAKAEVTSSEAEKKSLACVIVKT